MNEGNPPELAVRGGPERVPSTELHERARMLEVHPWAVELMMRRGIVELQQQRGHLDPKLRDLRPPSDMAGFDAALDLLMHARRVGVRVGVFGDYDVDGVTTAAILSSYLEQLGIEVVARVARRESGYGLGVEDARALVEAGAGLVLTGDCGTSDAEALQWLGDHGVRTVVIDHHQVPESKPPADALINPHQSDCRFPFKGLCSAGVGFYLSAALRTAIARAEPGARPPDPRGLLDLVALGTVCDMVPLLAENRVLVRHGLAALHARRRPGLRALLQQAGVALTEAIDEGHVGFRLGPRLNAPGRLGPADPALSLLRATGDLEARSRAEQLEALNTQRKQLTERIVSEALALLAAQPETARRAALVVAKAGWLPGLAGIAANAIVEHHQRPALVLAIDPESGEARGSARSFGAVDIRRALAECAPALRRYGGHPQAAGVSLEGTRIAELTEALDRAVAAQATASPEPSRTATLVDGELGLGQVDGELLRAMAMVGPFGVQFEPPLFLCQEATVEHCRVLKDAHLSLTLRQAGATRRGIAFGQADWTPEPGQRISMVFVPTWNHFRGERRLQLRIQRLWPS